MAIKELVVGNFTFNIPQWTLRQKLDNQPLFMPLASAPLINGIAYANYDEDTLMASIVSGVADSLSNTNIVGIIEKAFEGVGIIPKGSAPKMAKTIEDLENIGVDLGCIYIVLFAIVKENYGDVLKKDTQDSLRNLFSV